MQLEDVIFMYVVTGAVYDNDDTQVCIAFENVRQMSEAAVLRLSFSTSRLEQAKGVLKRRNTLRD